MSIPPDYQGTTELPKRKTLDHSLVRQFALTVEEGPDTSRQYFSSGTRAVIGKQEHADFLLTDEAVSRFHCEISLAEDGRAILRDLGSLNGTFIGGVQVFHACLSNGGLIGVGNTKVRFQLGDTQVKVPLSDRDRFGVMVARSDSMRAVFALLEQAAATQATVLLEGETGTGKEAATESIHLESARKDKPFIVVDCGAIPPSLLESELFGHERGAFTGALTARQGAFEAADGGTIFLDEIGELSPEVQPKLLRALAKREIKPVGGKTYRPIDVRVIAATNRNLRTEINAKRFRSDLYFRLAVLEIRLPPLRERLEDLPPLVEHILSELDATQHPQAPALRTDQYRLQLERHSWPGNVRELRNYIERCLALEDSVPPLDQAAGSPNPGHVVVDPTIPWKSAREKLERQYLEAVLRLHQDNISAAARAAGIDRLSFYRLLWRHGLRMRGQ